MKTRIIIVIFVIGICFVNTKARAQPYIDSLSGDAINGSMIAINGSGFDVKMSEEPYIWDDFEGGVHNTSIHSQFPAIPSNNRAWIGNFASGCEPVYSNTQKRDGSLLSAKLDLNVGGVCSGRMLMQTGIPLTAGNKVYFSTWMRFDWGTAGGNGNRQIKTWRIFKYGIPQFDRTYTYVSNLVENEGATYKSFMATLYDGNTDFNENLELALEDEKWIRFEAELQISSAPNMADGIIRLWVSRADFSEKIYKEIDRSNVISIPGNGEIWDSFWLGQWIGNATDPRNTILYYDDVYFDTTWQRVEIGDASTWSGCAHREIQIPSTWSDNQITFTLNQGSLSPCDTYYLYVVDTNGNVNSEGYPIYLATGTGEKPCPPQGLGIKK